MERFIMDSSDNLKEMVLVKRYSLMEVFMKENGSKIKNQVSYVKSIIQSKTSFISVHLTIIKNQGEENYWIPYNNKYMKENF
jgi:hypothetical protein